MTKTIVSYGICDKSKDKNITNIINVLAID